MFRKKLFTALITGLSVTVFVLLLAVVVLFMSFTVETFAFARKNVRTDAIVVLTGGRGRVEEGARLYRQNQGRWLLLVGVDPAVRKGELYRERPGERTGEEVVLEKVSRNTLENALYARELIVRKKITSIRLLTSRYHMKRAVLIFSNILPRSVQIHPHPVDTSNLREEWWRHGGSLKLLFSEFYKYSLYRLFFMTGGKELSPSRPVVNE